LRDQLPFLKSNILRLAEIFFIMRCAAAFAADEPGVPDKLSDQFLVFPLRDPAEMVLGTAVLSTLARFTTFLPHVKPSLRKQR
jgi:hypothetical protein